MKSIIRLADYLLLVILLGACRADQLSFQDVKLPPYKGVWEAPIGSTTYTVKELIRELKVDSTKIIEGTSKRMSVVVRDTTTFKDIASVLSIKNFTSPSANLAPIKVAFTPLNAQTLLIDETLEFAQGGLGATELDSVFYTSGTLHLVINTGTLPAVESYEITFNDIVNITTGEVLQFKGSRINSGVVGLSKSIAGYKFKLKKTARGANQFTGWFKGTLKVASGTALTADQKITYKLRVSGAAFSKAFGYFGKQHVSNVKNETLTVDLFKDIKNTGIQFKDPQVKLTTLNSFGVPFGIQLRQVRALKKGVPLGTLSGNITNTAQPIRSPSTTQVGQVVASRISIDPSNSNLRDLFDKYPDQFVVQLDAEMNFKNPLSAGRRNFVLDTSKLQIITEINIPLDVKINGFVRDFVTNLGNVNLPNSDTLTLMAITENKMPVGAKIDLQLLDGRADVLFEPPNPIQFIKPFDPSKRAVGTAPEKHTAEIKLYKGYGYDELLRASAINLKMTLNTFEAAQGKYAQFYSDSSIKLRLKIKAHLNYNLNRR